MRCPSLHFDATGRAGADAQSAAIALVPIHDKAPIGRPSRPEMAALHAEEATSATAGKRGLAQAPLVAVLLGVPEVIAAFRAAEADAAVQLVGVLEIAKWP